MEIDLKWGVYMLSVRDLRKQFVGHERRIVNAVDGISFDIQPGKLFTLLGPSGCGKTTTLRCIAGLERPDIGVITVDSKPVLDTERGVFVPPNLRGFGMVFQSYAIWPHMTVFENVAFPLRVSRGKRYSQAQIKERVEHVLETVQMAGYGKRQATALSGGQQQRIALARALVHEPKLLLLDEPLSNLDAKLREQMRFEVKRLQRELGITTVFVTHDQGEALALSNEIAVLSEGKIIQQGEPREIYQFPNNQFVADFIGSTNFIAGMVQVAAAAGQRQPVETERGVLECTFSEDIPAGTQVVVSIRPENLQLSNARPENVEGNVLPGRTSNRVFLGEVMDYMVSVGEAELRVRTHPDLDIHTGEEVYLYAPAEKCMVVPLQRLSQSQEEASAQGSM